MERDTEITPFFDIISLSTRQVEKVFKKILLLI